MKRIMHLAFLLTLILVGAMVALPVFGAGNGDAGLERALAAQERHTDSLMTIDGVVGTAVGHDPEGQGAVFVFAATCGVNGVPTKLDGVPVVTHVTGEFSALHHCKGNHRNDPACDAGDPPPDPDPEPPGSECTSTTDRCPRPVPIGVSTGHPDITAGTIGARVTDGTNVYALSNNHVFADVNRGFLGDPEAGLPADNVLQPGDFDDGVDPDDAIGTLFDFEPINFTAGSTNTIDAAIPLTSVDALGNSTMSDGYGTPGSSTTTLGINDKVKKYGRTTGQTKGFVWALNATVDVNYGAPDGVARFEGQIIFKGQGTFSAGGDSGSLIVTQRGGNRPVALLFAGSSQFTIGNPIDAVLTRFGVTIDGS